MFEKKYNGREFTCNIADLQNSENLSILYVFIYCVFIVSEKKINENIRDINALNVFKSGNDKLSQVNIVAWKFWDKVKMDLKDVISYKKGLEELWAFKKQKSQELIKECNYNEHTKFYKWINPRIVIPESWTYYITSNESTSRIRSHVDDSKQYTDQEVISTTDWINPEFSWYWPLLVSFTLKNLLDAWWILYMSDSSNRVFQFRDKTRVPITIENDTERLINIYAKYQSLFESLYGQGENISVLNGKFLKFFSVYAADWTKIFSIGYTIHEDQNTIAITSESENITHDCLTLAVLGIVIANGIHFKKDNIIIERNGEKIPLKNFL